LQRSVELIFVHTADMQQGDVRSDLAGKYVFTRGSVLFAWCLGTVLLAVSVRPMDPLHSIAAQAIILCCCLAIQIKRHGMAEAGPALLFAGTMAVFVWARPLIALTSPEFDLRTIEVLGGISVAPDDLRIYLGVVAASIAAFSAALLSYQLPTRQYQRPVAAYDNAFDGNGLFTWQILCVIGSAASSLQSFLFLRYFLSGGSYYDLYTLGPDAVGFPGLSFFASLLFYGYLGILLSLAGKNSTAASRRRFAWTLFFIALSIFGLARGSRGEVFTQLLVGLWLFSYTRGKAVSVKAWIIFGIALVGLSQAVSTLREGGEATESDNVLTKAAEWFVYTQGLSGELVAPAHAYFGIGPSNLRFVFSPLLAPARRVFDPSFGSQTVEYGESSGLLSHELAFRASPASYLEGHAAGSTYLAEAYCAMGMAGVVACTGVLVWLVLRGPQLIRRSRSAVFVFSASLPYILFVPRESLLYPIMPTVKALALLFVCRRLQKLYVYLRGHSNLQSGSATTANHPNLYSGGG
jgi:oligosaccharide repeat unit polymerase